MTGIVNGTTNFILTRMDEQGSGFADALDEATALGYAEADPTADVEGFDAAAKAAILAGLAFHTRVVAADVHREGITEVTAADVASAKAMGCVVKLLAIAERDGDAVGVRVHPAMIPRTHPLASVREAYNAVFVEAASAGRLMFYGPGAGGSPTASAVLGDLVAVARNAVSGARGAGRLVDYAELRVRPMGEVVTRYHISLDVADKAGVLAAVASAFAEHDVSIRTVRQEGHGDDASLVVVTHTATDAALQARRRAAARARHRARRRVRDAGGGLDPVSQTMTEAGMTVMTGAWAGWRGLIEQYRDRLAVTPATPVVTLHGGRHAAGLRLPPVGGDRREGVAQGRGRQPHRVLQGPRHDDGHQQGGRGRLEGRHLRHHRQHQRLAPRPTPPRAG